MNYLLCLSYRLDLLLINILRYNTNYDQYSICGKTKRGRGSVRHFRLNVTIFGVKENLGSWEAGTRGGLTPQLPRQIEHGLWSYSSPIVQCNVNWYFLMEPSRKSHAIELGVAQCQMSPLKVWLHTALGCHESLYIYCPIYTASMFGGCCCT